VKSGVLNVRLCFHSSILTEPAGTSSSRHPYLGELWEVSAKETSNHTATPAVGALFPVRLFVVAGHLSCDASFIGRTGTDFIGVQNKRAASVPRAQTQLASWSYFLSQL
jgi:hypothetical protein